MLAPRVQDYRPFVLVLSLLIALCWLALFLWDLSPYGKYLDHAVLDENGAGLDRQYAGLAGLFIAGWVLMTVAMMVPTTVPLALLFRRSTAQRRDARSLAACLLAGYLLVWSVAGALAHLGDLGLHAAVAHSHWLEDRSWIFGAGVLLLAGAYQFSPLKRLCLEKCRSPYSFIVEHWGGRHAKLDAFRLGFDHGLFCVGCCWSLMLLMFAVGAGSILWMLALAAVMATEKNLPWGRKLSAPLGVLLLAAGAGLVIAQLSLGVACAHPSEGAC